MNIVEGINLDREAALHFCSQAQKTRDPSLLHSLCSIYEMPPMCQGPDRSHLGQRGAAQKGQACLANTQADVHSRLLSDTIMAQG